MSKNNFKWAQGTDANVLEPVRELAEHGWKHRDIPKASNVNWIFKQISEELTSIRKDIESHTETFHKQLSEQNERISSLGRDLEALKADHNKLKLLTANGFSRLYRRTDFNLGSLRQICRGLREMEKAIKRYHADFPTHPWPVNDPPIPPRDDLFPPDPRTNLDAAEVGG